MVSVTIHNVKISKLYQRIVYDQTESIPLITFDVLGTNWTFEFWGKACAACLFTVCLHGFNYTMTSNREKLDADYVSQVKNLPESWAIDPVKSDTMYRLKLKLVTEVSCVIKWHLFAMCYCVFRKFKNCFSFPVQWSHTRGQWDFAYSWTLC